MFVNVHAGFKLSETKAGLRFSGMSFDDNQNGEGSYQVYPAPHPRPFVLLFSSIHFSPPSVSTSPFCTTFYISKLVSCPILSLSLSLLLSSLFSL